MANYGQHISRQKTAQTSPIPGREKDMVPNSAGGFTFQVDKWKGLERFLVLGSEGGTYYISEQKLTRDNAKNVEACLKEDARRVVDTIVAISDAGRAPKNSPAVFALAMAAKLSDKVEDRQYALGALPKVCRIGTHLFEFVGVVKQLGGWGRGTVKGLSRWYLRNPDNLALQVVKYQNRAGWGHSDVLNMCHFPINLSKEEQGKVTPAHKAIARWVVDRENFDKPRTIKRKEAGKFIGTFEYGAGVRTDLPRIIMAFETAMTYGKSNGINLKELCKLIKDERLPREAVPTEALKHREVWEALLPAMPITAMIRNLGKLSSLGMLEKLSAGEKFVVGKLSDGEVLKRGRVHPMGLLIALKTYAQGRGIKGKLTWDVSQRVADALDQAFYGTFKNVRPTGKNWLFGVDVSGSMSGKMANTPLTYCEGAGAMALVTANVETNYGILGFCHHLKELKISPRMRLDQVAEILQDSNWGGTDCSKPITWAMDKKVEVDVFSIYTDCETYAGDIHPTQALKKYRQKTGRNAKEVVVGMAANPFTIADPNDAGQLDVVGFDSSVPGVIADFAVDGQWGSESVDGDGEDGGDGGGQAEGSED